jgi:hypothetical protein
MDIYQPMMFVGLGGTGCMVGAELERRLREELCGPDGRDLTQRVPGQGYLPYQLPSCMQFVYADLNESELTRLRSRVVPSKEHLAALARTQRVTHDLVPQFNTYQKVAMSLRTNAMDEVRPWLPPAASEPHIAPLVRGAGQLPTVGRAALFETFRNGLAPAEQPLTEAIGVISKSADELARLGGRLGETCDVFVAFSVAGGTGAGIFYDYLHLIGEAFGRTGYQAQIYPLVLMPSAFEEGLGGGRRAKLNAATALLDLFRLVDDQNGAAVSPDLTAGSGGESAGIAYPGRGRTTAMPAQTIQTGFLFSGSAGVNRDDLHRSIAALVLSLVGTGHENGGDPAHGDRLYQSFADQFINSGIDRVSAAPSGIGLRGVSTSLVAGMSVPVDDLADLVAIRLLGRAVTELGQTVRDNAEGNEHLIDRFLSASNLEELRASRPLPFTDVGPARGAEAITQELGARGQTMENNVISLENRLRRRMPEIVAAFDPARGVETLLGEIDPFRLRRVLLGHRDIADELDRGGVEGDLEARRQQPRRPAGVTAGPPPLADLRDGRLGLSKMRWTDEPVLRILEDQDSWYSWRSQAAWHEAWADASVRWGRTFGTLTAQVRSLVDAFTEHARDEQGAFDSRAAELRRARAGVTYLLPPRRDLDAFYRDALERLVRRTTSNPRATEADVVNVLLGSDGWRQCWLTSTRDGTAAALGLVRERLKEAVKRLFTDPDADGGEPLLPPLATLLANATHGRGGGVADDDVRQFEAKVHGLVPKGFTPQGSGELKVLISYPASAPDRAVEQFLREQLSLPREPGMKIEYRPISAESITVVLLRTSMSIAEVPELREVLRHWSDAVRNQEPNDFLRWRQRLGYDYTWLATTENDRVRILHHLLCAAWNGHVTPAGDHDSPSRVRVTLRPEDDVVSMTLTLRPFEPVSSWASVLRAYEEWTLEDDSSIRRDFCAQLMRSSPTGVSTMPNRPAPLYERLIAVAGKQVALLDELRGRPSNGRGWAAQPYEFWARTVPAALDLPFENVSDPVRRNLRELYEMVSARRGRGLAAEANERGDDFGDEDFQGPGDIDGEGQRW